MYSYIIYQVFPTYDPQVNWCFDNSFWAHSDFPKTHSPYRIENFADGTSAWSYGWILFRGTQLQKSYATCPTKTLFQDSNNVHVEQFQYLARPTYASKLFQKFKYRTNLSDERLRATLLVCKFDKTSNSKLLIN